MTSREIEIKADKVGEDEVITVKIDAKGGFSKYIVNHLIPGLVYGSTYLMSNIKSGQISNREVLLGAYSLMVTSLYISNFIDKNHNDYLNHFKYGTFLLSGLGFAKLYLS